MVAAALARNPLFEGLDAGDLEQLAWLMQPKRFAPGDVICEEGQAGDSLFVITEGEAGVHVNGNSATTLSAGDHFGEIALVSEVERTATVTARTELRCLEIPFWDFRDFALTNPDVTWKLLQHVVEVLSAKTAPAPA